MSARRRLGLVLGSVVVAGLFLGGLIWTGYTYLVTVDGDAGSGWETSFGLAAVGLALGIFPLVGSMRSTRAGEWSRGVAIGLVAMLVLYAGSLVAASLG